MRATLCALCALALAAACAGDDGPAPVATVIEASPTMLDSASDDLDDLTIVVEYRDGDGDLGGGSLEIADCRAEGIVSVTPLPPIASMIAVEQGVPIEGELEVLVNDIGLVEPDASVPAACAELGVNLTPAADQVVFCVVLVDAAGNRGRGDCTDPVPIQ
jgi:hypothetical protein